MTIFENQECCGIVDTKVKKNRYYNIPARDHRYMGICIVSYLDLLNQLNLPHLKLSYVCFVSSGFSNISGNLSLLTKETGIPISAVAIIDLINISKMAISARHFLHVMSKGGIITSDSFKEIV